MLGAFLAGLVLGAFCLAVVVVLVVNVKQTPLPPDLRPPADIRWR